MEVLQLELDPLLGPNSRVKWMLYLPHLSYQVGVQNQSLRCVTAGNDDVQSRLPFPHRAKFFEHLFERQHSIAEHVDQFIEDQQIVISAAEFLDTEVPGVASCLPILFRVFCVPGEPVAHGMNLDAELFSRNMLAIPVVPRFHELDHAAFKAPAGSSHHEPEGGGSFPFAVACVNYEQTASFLLIVLAPPFVLLLF